MGAYPIMYPADTPEGREEQIAYLEGCIAAGERELEFLNVAKWCVLGMVALFVISLVANI